MLKKHGNPMRNKYMTQEADFVMFADDDNWYTSDALKVRFVVLLLWFLIFQAEFRKHYLCLQVIRETVQHDMDALYIFQMQHAEFGYRIPDITGQWRGRGRDLPACCMIRALVCPGSYIMLYHFLGSCSSHQLPSYLDLFNRSRTACCMSGSLQCAHLWRVGLYSQKIIPDDNTLSDAIRRAWLQVA